MVILRLATALLDDLTQLSLGALWRIMVVSVFVGPVVWWVMK